MWDFSLLRSRIQNKLRSWNISYESLSPIIILPFFIYTAALGREFTIILFLALPIFFCVLHRRHQRLQHRSRFFYVWSLWSVVFGYLLFQTTVPMIELLPEENIVFLVCVVLTVFLFYKTKSHAYNKSYWPTGVPNEISTEGSIENLLPPTETEGSSEKFIDPSDVEAANSSCGRVYQCNTCQMGIPELDHHNVWLDCCIGASNRKFFLLGCIMALVTLLLEANLSLTSICHPYLIANIFGLHILMPDDCSDVYDQYDLAVCFVTSVYCLFMAFYVLIVAIYQIFLISRGVTGMERTLNVAPGKKLSIYCNWVNYVRN